jgi:formate dehydrogenase subunit gamma
MSDTDPSTMSNIPRFSAGERAIHWLVALTFIYAALSGLSLWSNKLYWIAAVLGGGNTVRAVHPIIALIFFLVFGLMFIRWASQMRLDSDDRKWLARSRSYATNQEDGLPEAGKFNGGQKMMFWMQAVFALLLLASGIILWFPGQMPRPARLIAVLVHPVAAIGSIGGIILHIYMGTAVVPGSIKAMVRGTVTSRWASAHHPKWFREQQLK